MKVIIGIIWILVYLSFVFFGAGLFHTFERSPELERCENAKKYLQSLFENITENNVNISALDLREIINNISEFRSQGLQFNGSNVQCTSFWDFASSFFFTGTIVTTIGYGNVAPTTDASKIFCIFYALVGVPLFALLFVRMGGIFSRGLKFISTYVDKLETKVWIENLTITCIFVVVGFTLFSLIPAAAFSSLENWNYLDSVYYTIVTLTTIGFGDYVPAETPPLDEPSIRLYKIMVYMWILFGLAFAATYISLISERINTHASRLAKIAVDKNEGSVSNQSVEAEDAETSDKMMPHYTPDPGAQVHERSSLSAEKV